MNGNTANLFTAKIKGDSTGQQHMRMPKSFKKGRHEFRESKEKILESINE